MIDKSNLILFSLVYYFNGNVSNVNELTYQMVATAIILLVIYHSTATIDMNTKWPYLIDSELTGQYLNSALHCKSKNLAN